jgi:ABC-2 type transport system permease protein
MRKIWLVAKAEYLRLVKRRSFLLATLGIPLLIGVVMAVSILVAMGGRDERPIGVVDRAGILGDVAAHAAAQGLNAVALPDDADANAALEAGKIRAYYLVPADYLTSQRVQLFYWQKAPTDTGQINGLLRAVLIARAPADVREQLTRGVAFTYRSLEGEERGIEKQVLGFLLPLFVGMFFVFVVMGSAGYLLQAVTTEKENRMVEVMFTSASPSQIIVGKALGLMAVAFTQIAVWVLALVVALVIAALKIPFFRAIRIEPTFLLLMLLYFVPTYALVAGIMITLGSMVTEQQQGQQIAGMINLLFLAPFFTFIFIFTNPDSPLMVAMTLFPTTAFLTVAMRWGVTTIPAWQLALGWMLLVGSATFMVLVAARVFRIGMLQYGQPLSLRTVRDIVRAPGAR